MSVNTYEGLLALLEKNDVRFMVVGGLACALNGFVRTTEDMDILVDDEHSNLMKLLECLDHFGEGCAKELEVEDFPDEEGAIRIQEDFCLDIFVRMSGKKYQDLVGNMCEHETQDGSLVPYVDAKGLISLKEGSVREKDRIDVLALLRIANAPESKEAAPLSLNTLKTVPPPPGGGGYGGR
jgi:hypothetical protein